ncbi:FecR family protein [Mucilaginibacter arboris]|uniref:DUF4974 domain-containing protein n=1 Tax=Mucilaginibacter arboris TaxID=2682090 RepID=A0A7K1ST12_9SPHI|nr:FecR family protein [Mucilaginibacter arboris]MVN20453.1 DUF4974 domain-containing protein [Mucilaginibacter arboris]
MKNQEAKALLEKYKSGNISAEEQARLDSWYLSEAKSKQSTVDYDAMERHLDAIWASLPVHHQQKTVVVKSIWGRWMAAAAILIALSVGLYFYANRKSEYYASNTTNHPKQEITPGGNKAILILADGSKIDLNTTSNGEVAKQGSLTITKATTGQLIYKTLGPKGKYPQGTLAFNTVETPKGGQYAINLPDGTRVWLNAASSLKFPTQFASNERRVELTGEGYFEVAKDKTKPFKVVTDKQEIEVLGTHFNVNAYTDENAIRTTLLEGSVKITVGRTNQTVQQSVILKPDQQSALGRSGITIKDVDTEDAVAWKNGYFNFNENIESIMKKLSRWYNIEVVYETSKDPDLLFAGKVSRLKSINSVLNIIEATGNVHFRIEGRRVTVMK